MITFVVQWDAHSPEVSMNIWTAKVCIPWFATLSSKFPAEHLSLLLEWFTPFLSPLFLLSSSLSVKYFGQRLLFKRKYCRVVPIHSHLYWNLKREGSRSDTEFKIVIIFRWCSREDSLFQAFYYLNAWNRLQRRKKWICESNFYLEKKDGEIVLKRDHVYWHQVQGHLFLTKRKKCYFVVWTLKDFVVLEIQRDDSWEIKIEELKEFYLKHLFPKIIEGEL